ncbi:Nucleolar protein 16 [Exophiala dermatitidis]|uniref:Nucleolar protein 16 n=1 Tax=Exophiala dermatitidis TaxID=5970 RepID=A0AAN6EWA7_EXODE|nr:Nucleolar protein 16 [Exophiala dermatitidis]KAJ4515948.1 Nucleolar protein 16 [Exophiala dermatitidis]KAJ4518646.1 Nucleolar protein 16 [Exophiala dermatitidis]KAJ4534159.1 Nucleolar protein 16 [Exophiala dermatitidis]KAJ4545942.1 Nucleolar protein 16 [Exophiala dermatitidis]
MGRERQKKKNRSSKPKVRPHTHRTKAGKKKVNFLGNETIAQNWDRKLTVAQNYKRLGLSSRLNAVTGGTEKRRTEDGKIESEPRDPLVIAGPQVTGKIATQEVQVERDPETGRIVRVIRPDNDKAPNPLNDPLNDIMDVDTERSEKKHKSAVVAQLEAQVAEEEELLAKKKRPRKQSQREEEWIARLVEVHGDDIRAMARDRKLNPMQQSEGDISKRIKKWKASREAEATT